MKSTSYADKLIVAGVSFLLAALAADFFLQWRFHIPSNYLRRIVTHDPASKPPKRLKAGLDTVIVGEYNEFKFRLTTDENGFRRSRRPATETPELLFLGDSQTAGVGVDDDKTFPSLTAAALGRTVLNAACYGYNTFEELELYETLEASRDPQGVVLSFFAGNDPYENHKHSSKNIGGQAPAKPRVGLAVVKSWLKRHSALYNALYRLRGHEGFNKALGRLGVVEKNPPDELLIFKKEAESESHWTPTFEAVEKLSDETRGQKRDFLVLFIPDRYQVDAEYWGQWVKKYGLRPSDYDLNAPNRRLAMFCRERGIPFLDVTDALRAAHASGKRVYWRIDNHLNAEGNRVIADALSDFFSR